MNARTSEEWATLITDGEFIGDKRSRPGVSSIVVDLVNQIINDGIRQGLERAAEIAGSKIHTWKYDGLTAVDCTPTKRMAACEIEKAILAERDNVK
jgi:hypothetical protein